MSLFLDSNALLWWLTGQRLPAPLAEQLDREVPTISVVSPWELWIKVERGRLRLPPDFMERLQHPEALSLAAPTLEDSRLAAALPPVNRDPFDRMIVAQAMNRKAILITGDRQLPAYGLETILV